MLHKHQLFGVVIGVPGYVKTVMVNNSTNINRHSLKHKKVGQHHLMLEMQVMAWDRINDGVRKMHCNRVQQ
jgi:adenylate kinase